MHMCGNTSRLFAIYAQAVNMLHEEVGSLSEGTCGDMLVLPIYAALPPELQACCPLLSLPSYIPALARSLARSLTHSLAHPHSHLHTHDCQTLVGELSIFSTK